MRGEGTYKEHLQNARTAKKLGVATYTDMGVYLMHYGIYACM